jgi:hypothetical protein
MTVAEFLELGRIAEKARRLMVRQKMFNYTPYSLTVPVESMLTTRFRRYHL